MSHRLVAFYLGTGRDDQGRTFEDVLSFTFEELEYVHDYIQWLFPLLEHSGANPTAPVLDDYSVASFRRNPELRRNVRRALELMLSFYGLQVSQKNGIVVIDPTPAFDERSANWLLPGNHNFLRLTRILKCLSILNASELARALLDSLLAIDKAHHGIIPDRTFEYWRDAVPP